MGLLAVGETMIEGLLEGDDVLRTAQACRALGAKVERLGPGRWRVEGAGLGTLATPREVLDFGNAGTGTRLLMGVVGGHAITATFDGDASLRKRPMRRILDPLTLMGAEVVSEAEGGRVPVTLKGAADPTPIEYRTPVPSAQLKSAVLLAGLNSPGRTVVIETEASRDHTEKLLAYFGAQIASEPHGEHGRKITLEGRPTLRPRPVIVPADPSSAAFALVAALIVPGSDVVIEGLMMNPLRVGLLDSLMEMGADIDVLDRRIEGGEDVADLRVRHGALRGADIPAARAPAMIDEYPILAVAAAFATGETRMRRPERAQGEGIRSSGGGRRRAHRLRRQEPHRGRRSDRGGRWLRARGRDGRHPSRSPHRHELPRHGPRQRRARHRRRRQYDRHELPHLPPGHGTAGRHIRLKP